MDLLFLSDTNKWIKYFPFLIPSMVNIGRCDPHKQNPFCVFNNF